MSRLRSGRGADIVRGGADDDLIYLGKNPLLEGPQGDQGSGGPGNDVIYGGPGFDVLARPGAQRSLPA